jgi:hypothetical protein
MSRKAYEKEAGEGNKEGRMKMKGECTNNCESVTIPKSAIVKKHAFI